MTLGLPVGGDPISNPGSGVAVLVSAAAKISDPRFDRWTNWPWPEFQIEYFIFNQ